MSTARFRRSYARDPKLADGVFALLETWLTGIQEKRREAARLGASWEACSIPFVHEIDGRIVSHVGLIEMPFVINGRPIKSGGLHGVCTIQSERRRGHFGRIMEELIEYCEGRYSTLELGTENPEYYEPFGFRVVPEHRFVATVARRVGSDGFRVFDVTREGDLERLDRLLRDRAPVSGLIGVADEHQVFKFSQGTEGLHYSKALDCFAVFERVGSRLSLFDVVASKMPSMDALLAQFATPIETVEFYFSPDRFEVESRSELYRWDNDYYMVRGPFELEGQYFMVPPPARH